MSEVATDILTIVLSFITGGFVSLVIFAALFASKEKH